MHYAIRGLMEENMDWLLDFTAKFIGREPSYWNLPDEVKHQIAFDVAFNRLSGFHAMWMMIEGNEPEDDHGKVIQQMVINNMESLIYAIDEYETEAKHNRDNKSEVPTYNIDISE